MGEELKQDLSDNALVKTAYDMMEESVKLTTKGNELKQSALELMKDVLEHFEINNYDDVERGCFYCKSGSVRKTVDQKKLKQLLVLKGVDVDVVNKCFMEATKETNINGGVVFKKAKGGSDGE